MKKQTSQKEEPSDVQRRKVDNLLTDLVRKFPPKAFARKVSELGAVKDSVLNCFFYLHVQDGSKPVVGELYCAHKRDLLTAT